MIIWATGAGTVIWSAIWFNPSLELSAGAADSHFVEFNGGHAYAYGDALSSFAAGANAFVEFEVVADHGDVLECFRPIADQGGVFNRGGDHTVFNEVGFGSGENELAIRDVDLAAAEVDSVEATLDAADDVFWFIFAGQHVGVGHAGHGNALVVFTAAGAGVGCAGETGGEFVSEIALEDTVLDEDSFLGGRAFVINVEGAPASGHGPVIYNRNLRTGDGLTNEAGKSGGFLAVEVGFKAVADCFMKEDAGPTWAENHFHFAGGSGNGAELEDGAARCFAGQVFGAFRAVEDVEPAAAAAAGRAFRGVLVVFGDDEDVETAQRLGVRGKSAVGRGDQDAAKFFAVAGANLDDIRTEGAGGSIGSLDEVETGGQVEIKTAERDGVEVSEWGILKTLNRLLGWTGGDQGRGFGGVDEALGAEIVGVGVAGAFAGEYADAAAGAGTLAGGFHDLLVDAERGGGYGFKVEVGVIASCGECLAEATLQEAFGDAKFLEKVTAMAGSRAGGLGYRKSTHRT